MKTDFISHPLCFRLCYTYTKTSRLVYWWVDGVYNCKVKVVSKGVIKYLTAPKHINFQVPVMHIFCTKFCYPRSVVAPLHMRHNSHYVDCTILHMFRHDFLRYQWKTFCWPDALQWRHNERNSVSNHQPPRLFTQPFIQTQIKENIKAPRNWPLCGDFTDDRWIPRTNGQ